MIACVTQAGDPSKCAAEGTERVGGTQGSRDIGCGLLLSTHGGPRCGPRCGTLPRNRLFKADAGGVPSRQGSTVIFTALSPQRVRSSPPDPRQGLLDAVPHGIRRGGLEIPVGPDAITPR